MNKIENKETRYYVDIDLPSKKIIGWGYDQRVNLDQKISDDNSMVRIFITKGQYNKLR